MEHTRAEQMLLQAIAAALGGASVSWTDVSEEEWDALMRLSIQHKVQPLIFDAVYDCPAAATWKDRDKIRNAAKQQMVLQTVKTAEFSTLYSELQATGAKPLVVKGILCRAIYPNGELRQSSDEDLYAPGEFFEACKELLLSRGYVASPAEEEADELSFGKPGSSLHLELHRTLFGKKSAAVVRLEDLFADAGQQITTYEAFGTLYESLSPHDHLLYLLLHAYKHFIRSGFGIRQVCDIGLWAKEYFAQIDWDKLYRQCAEVRADKFSAAVFRIAEKTLGIPLKLPSVWNYIETEEAPLLSDLLDAGIYGGADMIRAHTASITLNAVSAKQTKRSSSLLRTAFPPKSSLQREYPELKEHGYLLPYAWVKRLLRYRKETKNVESGSTAETLKLAQNRKDLLKKYGIL